MPGSFICSRRAILFGSGAVVVAPEEEEEAVTDARIFAPGVYVNETSTSRQYIVAPGVYINETG